jgi:hypothetical protein
MTDAGAAQRVLDRLFPSRVENRRRHEFFEDYHRMTTCVTCGDSLTTHSVVRPNQPCLRSKCDCAAFVWPEVPDDR